jgi:hypothetical protein
MMTGMSGLIEKTSRASLSPVISGMVMSVIRISNAPGSALTP